MSRRPFLAILRSSTIAERLTAQLLAGAPARDRLPFAELAPKDAEALAADALDVVRYLAGR